MFVVKCAVDCPYCIHIFNATVCQALSYLLHFPKVTIKDDLQRV